VVQKFNEEKGWNLEDFEALKEHIDITKEGREEANRIINSLKICDPAVGSGHFLVSALNEMIAMKSELKVLSYRDGKRMKLYSARVENDELIIEDEDEGGIFEYGLSKQGTFIPEKQAVQEAIFHEKQTIIENCLFGVDINANSVKICRLRLWIELLKHAYYHEADASDSPEGETHAAPQPPAAAGEANHDKTDKRDKDLELQTLPNIDINIKAGNSLVSRFSLNASLKSALKGTNWKIGDYRKFVNDYKNAQNKDDKNSLKELIDQIKKDFRTEITRDNPKQRKLNKLSQQLYDKYTGNKLFEEQLTKKQKQDRAKLEKEITKLQKEIDDLKNNEIYRNAFEWRFEFPEVLDDEGNFLGFDVVIGNPPYIGGREWKLKDTEFNFYVSNYKVAEYQFDSYILFWEKSNSLINKGYIALITPNTWLNNQRNKKLRTFLLDYNRFISIIDYSKIKVFEDAVVLPIITILGKNVKYEDCEIYLPYGKDFKYLKLDKRINPEIWKDGNLNIININLSELDIRLRQKIENNSYHLEELAEVKFGIKIYETGKGTPPQEPEDAKKRVFESNKKIDNSYRMYLEGKDVDNYVINWRNRWLKYGKNLAAPRNPVLFNGERLLVRRVVGKRLICAYTNEDYVTSQLLQIVKPYKAENTKIFLGILSSRLLAYYFRKKYNRDDKTFPEIRIYELRSLPIKIPNNNNSLFTNKVDQILQQKQQDSVADTSNLEAEIDRMVYELYGLTEEEVRIVEESV
jgi:hypothetical protein